MHVFMTLWRAIWADNPASGRLIIVIIVLLGVWALRSGLRHLKRYRRVERRELERVAARLRDQQGPVDGAAERPPETAEPPTESEPPQPRRAALARLAELKEGLARDSLISERLEAVEKLRARQAKVNLATLQQLTIAREEARHGLAAPAFAASLSMMLGLLGTFVGLAIMVQDIRLALPGDTADLTMESWTRSIDNVIAVLGGIRTAFTTSLVGMVAAISCSLLSFRLRGAQASFLQELERFTTEELLPATFPAVEEETLLEQVSQQLETSFTKLEEISQQNRDVLEDLTAAQQAFVDVVGEVRQITRGEAARDLDRVVEELGRASRAVVELSERLPQVARAIDSGNRRLLERLGSLLTEALPSAPARPAGIVGGRGVVIAMVALIVIVLALQAVDWLVGS